MISSESRDLLDAVAGPDVEPLDKREFHSLPTFDRCLDWITRGLDGERRGPALICRCVVSVDFCASLAIDRRAGKVCPAACLCCGPPSLCETNVWISVKEHYVKGRDGRKQMSWRRISFARPFNKASAGGGGRRAGVLIFRPAPDGRDFERRRGGRHWRFRAPSPVTEVTFVHFTRDVKL